MPTSSTPNKSRHLKTSITNNVPQESAGKEAANTPLLEYRQVSKYFGNKCVLQNINLTIPHDKIVGLLGKNGTGKSTLIKLANDLLVPTSGEVLFEGQPLGVASKSAIAYLPERTYLDKSITIAQALRYFTEFYDNFDRAKAEQLLQILDLSPDMKISKISKGMQEKLQLILVMSRHAKLYILDEPLGGVDPATRDYILDTILNNFDAGASVLISTHLIADIERILDEVIFIDQGQIILQADADKLRNQKQASIDTIFRQQFKAHIN